MPAAIGRGSVRLAGDDHTEAPPGKMSRSSAVSAMGETAGGGDGCPVGAAQSARTGDVAAAASCLDGVEGTSGDGSVTEGPATQEESASVPPVAEPMPNWSTMERRRTRRSMLKDAVLDNSSKVLLSRFMESCEGAHCECSYSAGHCSSIVAQSEAEIRGVKSFAGAFTDLHRALQVHGPDPQGCLIVIEEDPAEGDGHVCRVCASHGDH